MDTDEELFSSDESGISEQDLIEHVDILFRTSDLEGSGYVPVSRIIQYLRVQTSFGESEEDLSFLMRLADPSGGDPSLTLEQYREIMWKWIKHLQQGGARNVSDGGSEYEDILSDPANRVSSKDRGGSSNAGFDKQDDKLGVGFGVSADEVQQYMDRIQELVFQNSRLTEENSTLQQQIYSQEEALAQSNASNQGLGKKIKGLQEAIQLRQQHECENEDLILKLQDQKQEMQQKIGNLTSDLEHLRASNKDLEASNVEYQHQLEQLSEIRRYQETQLSERFEELKNQQNQILSLSGTVQELKIEKENLQAKICQSNEAIESLKQTVECKDKGDNLMRFPCSTPIKRNNSICMELRGMLEDGDHMPSPLCEKEIDQMDQVFPLFSSDDEDVDESDPNVSIYSVSLKDDLTLDMSKFMEKYQSKQENLLEEIRHFLEPGKSNNVKDEKFSEFVKKVEEQMSKLAQKVSVLAQAKTDVDHRLGKQKKKFRKLREENAVLKEAADDVIENKISWDSVTDKRLLILKDQIDQERANIKFLERKLKDKESTFVHVDKNKRFGAERVLKMEIQKLQSLNKDLTERNKKLEGKVSGLVEEVTKAHRDVETQQAKVIELQAERDVLVLQKERAEHQLMDRTRQGILDQGDVLELRIQKDEKQLTERMGQDSERHIRTPESQMRGNRSLPLPYSRKTGDRGRGTQMSGVLPFDLLATDSLGIQKKESSSKKSPSQNATILHTDEDPREGTQGSHEHLWLDRRKLSAEGSVTDQGEGEGDCGYKGGGRRRYSYHAAIDNHTCPPGEQHYPRYRSGSFQAAIEGSLKGGEEGEVTEDTDHVTFPTDIPSDAGDSCKSFTSCYNNNCFQIADHISSTNLSSCLGSSAAYCVNSSKVCYSVCDSASVLTSGWVGCGGDFTVNSSYRKCTDSSHNHSDVIIKHLTSSHCDVTTGGGRGDGGDSGHCGTKWNHFGTTDGQRGSCGGQFGTEWRGVADDSGSTVEDSNLSHRSEDYTDSPEAPDVIQITKSGKTNTETGKPSSMSYIESHSSSLSPSAELESSDHNTRKTLTPASIVSGNGIQREGSEEGLNVTRSGNENKNTKVNDKEESEVMDIREEMDDVIEDDEAKNNGEDDDDDDNVLVTNNLIQQLERLNLSDGGVSAAKNSPHLKKIRQGNLAKRREQMKFLRMPDLNEMQESGQPVMNGEGEPDNPVMPSISQSMLHDLGVDQDREHEDSPDQLSEQEIENKFTSLSLAFKTDKITLEKRLEIQERSRDIAEENVAKEIKGLREALEQLNQICVDTQVRELLLKIQRHITVLEQASARVSSRAEVFGAVQQEKRMSKAIEIMLTHVDNLRMSHDRQTAELEEARKLIQDNRPFGGSSEMGEFVGLSRRSASVCQSNAFLPKGAWRRVSDVSLTRSGLPHSMSMDNISESMHVTPPLRRELSVTEEDPRSKFQQLATAAALKNTTTAAFRRASLNKQTSTSSLLGGSLRMSQESNQSDTKSTGTNSKQHSVEEEAFQKGFEQGYKAQITGQLKQLRDQQNSITDTLEELRDKCDEEEENNAQEVSLREAVLSKLWEHVPEWETASNKLRLATVLFFLFMAALSIILSFFPVTYAAVQVYPEYQHITTPPV